MIFPRPPLLLKTLTSGIVNWSVPVNEKCIYITFDDGPIPEVTPWVLETLSAFDAKATFFCVGDNVNRNWDIYRQIISAGHRVGNHSFHHIKAWGTPKEAYLKDVEQAHKLINSRLYRPPHGQLTYPLIRALRKDFSIVLWSVLAYDFDRSLKPEKCLAILLKYTKPGNIVVFHDSLKAEPRLRYALPLFLKHFQSEGFVFRSLPETL
ncbi:MAG: polysaccharide deacetylase family protein [Bacteroidota bacterium]|nr:polysaccharide deacetylase family protein [Bacteroidota bacterium]